MRFGLLDNAVCLFVSERSERRPEVCVRRDRVVIASWHWDNVYGAESRCVLCYSEQTSRNLWSTWPSLISLQETERPDHVTLPSVLERSTGKARLNKHVPLICILCSNSSS